MKQSLSNVATSKDFRDDLEKVGACDRSKLDEARREFDRSFTNENHESLTLVGFKRYLVRYLNDQEANHVIDFLLSLYSIIEGKSVSADDIKDMIREVSLEINIDRPDSLASAVGDFLKSKNMALVSKASDLYFDTDETIDSFKILTESRPVFNDDASSIVGFIVRNVLTLRVGAGSVRHDYALSMHDIEALAEELTRAKRKTDVLRSDLEARYKGKVALFGDRYVRS